MPLSDPDSLSQLSRQAIATFRARLGRQPTVLVAAPGRVNLIGDHVDYNDGLVLPMAITRYTVIAADRCPDPEHRYLWSQQFESAVDPGRESSDDGSGNQPSWGRYAQGVYAGYRRRGWPIPGFDGVILSDVPLGGGLSSSAALEVSVALMIESLSGRRLPKPERALLCQAAEHQYAGVPCGIMDQFSCVFGVANQLMLIDCQRNNVQYLRFEQPEVCVLIIDSRIQHELANGEYGRRRQQCSEALKGLARPGWRDVRFDDLPRLAEDPLLFRRARHVVSEIQRTSEAADAFQRNALDEVGPLMSASHRSLRDDFQVSCPECDWLVERLDAIGMEGGVFGSRMTGGGFGGCIVSLVRRDQVEAVSRKILVEYQLETNITARSLASRPGRGAHVIRGPAKNG